MRRGILAGAAGLGFACGSSSPEPGAPPPPEAAPAAAAAAALRPAITGRVQYYDIDGTSPGELREQIKRLGPRDEGAPRDALTVWNLEWAYHEATGPSGGSCGLRDVRVTLDLETTLPRWTPPQGASPSLVQTWRTYLDHVKVHEAGHRRIAEQNARDLMNALTALRGTTCKEAWDQASPTAERIVSEGRVKNRAYDLETKHGQTQGVVLGP
ncbi:MAG TPA: DUF922 domain-containing protein [Gemmatimonadales bacterium]|nr:DUF922 domain-containing protein [Gemmatimonadales bacterium]